MTNTKLSVIPPWPAPTGSATLDRAYKAGWEASDQAYGRETNPHPNGTALRELGLNYRQETSK